MVRWYTLDRGVMTTPVTGVCGQQLDVSEAQDRADGYRDAIDLGEAEGRPRGSSGTAECPCPPG